VPAKPARANVTTACPGFSGVGQGRGSSPPRERQAEIDDPTEGSRRAVDQYVRRLGRFRAVGRRPLVCASCKPGQLGAPTAGEPGRRGRGPFLSSVARGPRGRAASPRCTPFVRNGAPSTFAERSGRAEVWVVEPPRQRSASTVRKTLEGARGPSARPLFLESEGDLQRPPGGSSTRSWGQVDRNPSPLPQAARKDPVPANAEPGLPSSGGGSRGRRLPPGARPGPGPESTGRVEAPAAVRAGRAPGAAGVEGHRRVDSSRPPARGGAEVPAQAIDGPLPWRNGPLPGNAGTRARRSPECVIATRPGSRGGGGRSRPPIIRRGAQVGSNNPWPEWAGMPGCRCRYGSWVKQLNDKFRVHDQWNGSVGRAGRAGAAGTGGARKTLDSNANGAAHAGGDSVVPVERDPPSRNLQSF